MSSGLDSLVLGEAQILAQAPILAAAGNNPSVDDGRRGPWGAKNQAQRIRRIPNPLTVVRSRHLLPIMSFPECVAKGSRGVEPCSRLVVVATASVVNRLQPFADGALWRSHWAKLLERVLDGSMTCQICVK